MARNWKTIGLAALALWATQAASPARGQAWPSQPLRILVSFAPGGGADLLTRAIAAKAGQGLGAAIIIENRTGAGGQLALRALLAAPADGRYQRRR